MNPKTRRAGEGWPRSEARSWRDPALTPRGVPTCWREGPGTRAVPRFVARSTPIPKSRRVLPLAGACGTELFLRQRGPSFDSHCGWPVRSSPRWPAGTQWITRSPTQSLAADEAHRRCQCGPNWPQPPRPRLRGAREGTTNPNATCGYCHQLRISLERPGARRGRDPSSATGQRGEKRTPPHLRLPVS